MFISFIIAKATIFKLFPLGYIMEKHILRYEKVILQIINKSFPILKGKKIRVYEKIKLKFSSADANKFLFYGLRIRTHPRLRKYNQNLLIGIFAHEISHLEYFEKRPFYHYFIRGFKKKPDKLEEEKTDKTAIKKGYARELYLQRKSRWKSNNPNKKFYLSPLEIKKYAESIGKW